VPPEHAQVSDTPMEVIHVRSRDLEKACMMTQSPIGLKSPRRCLHSAVGLFAHSAQVS
jgi:hypothetical protein